jgi:hypothetical protein
MHGLCMLADRDVESRHIMVPFCDSQYGWAGGQDLITPFMERMELWKVAVNHGYRYLGG